jgi:RNA polymerase sigma-70 factor, ECF subfamily
MPAFDEDPAQTHDDADADPADIAPDAEGAWGPPPPEPPAAASPAAAEAQSPVESVDFAAIYNEHYPFVLGLMARRKDIVPASAEELAQSTFTRLSQQIEEEGPPRNVKAMLVTILGHKICNHGRHVRPDVDPGAEVDAQERPEGEPDPEECADFAERRRILDEQLEGMKGQEADVLRCTELFGLSCAETAKLLEIPLGTVASVHQRAMAKLQAGIRARVSGGAPPRRRPRP